jgi:ankyrin repeat protein
MNSEQNIIEIVKSQDTSLLESALHRGVAVAVSDEDERNALHWAVIVNDLAAVSILIKARANPNHRDVSHRTPLDLAIDASYHDLAVALIGGGTDLYDSYEGFGYAHRCAALGNSAILALVLSVDDKRRLLGMRDRPGDGRLPLHWAAQTGDVPTLSLLLDAGSDVSAVAEGFAPLHIAAGEGHVEAVRVLLRFGADVNQRCEACDNGTALHSACAWGHSQVAKVLLECGANPSITDDEGMTPIQYAKSKAIIRMLRHVG